MSEKNHNQNKRKQMEVDTKVKTPAAAVVPTKAPTAKPAAAKPAAGAVDKKKKDDNKKKFNNKYNKFNGPKKYIKKKKTPKAATADGADNNNNNKKNEHIVKKQKVAEIVEPIVIEPPKPVEPIDAAKIGSNWELLKKKRKVKPQQPSQEEKKPEQEQSSSSSTTRSVPPKKKDELDGIEIDESKSIFDLRTTIDKSYVVYECQRGTKGTNTRSTKRVAIDCEMVEVIDDEGARKSSLGSVCVINQYGNTIYKSFAKPDRRVSDFRTRWSGLTKAKIDSAPPAAQVQKAVAQLLRDKIVIGHDLATDLKVLEIHVDPKFQRDSSSFDPLMCDQELQVKKKKDSHSAAPQKKLNLQDLMTNDDDNNNSAGGAKENELVTVTRRMPQSLKKLAAIHLGVRIQKGQHNAEEDALTSMMLYNKFKKQWEDETTKKFYHQKKPNQIKKQEQQEKYDEYKRNKEYYFQSLKK
ncbi:RNA exonuclease 4 [Cavenderia fasciculata]|uniref:RNA exonuclease 4 n=1 Tax=Cavenderia fasciculata TaxID=261658 RepID=F4PQE3_CACFS|nr:RNA exonuclease 4 [Cavenderia fasciculata]EGG22606.1 RNA exonuclease 4 [Cavenderia fasciculata]|eukprot:XP_004360457.1 RNA exonuclease 4 [Cavenderia fasciculata]